MLFAKNPKDHMGYPSDLLIQVFFLKTFQEPLDGNYWNFPKLITEGSSTTHLCLGSTWLKNGCHSHFDKIGYILGTVRDAELKFDEVVAVSKLQLWVLAMFVSKTS